METNNTKLNLSAGLLSVLVALVLVLAKGWALVATGSLSVAATLADSGLDLMMSLGGLVAIVYAAKPADEDHAFGHSSAEDLAALAQSLFIVISATVIAVVAVQRLLAGDSPLPKDEGKGIVVVAFSIVVTLALVTWQRHVAGRTGNKVVAADSLHYIGDLVPNIGAIAALFVSARYGWGHVDSVVALGAAAFLVFGAMRIGKSAWDALMDRQADPAMIDGIAAIARDFPGLHGYHDLKTRTAGSRIFVSIHIELDGNQPLHKAHAIGAALRHRIIETYPQCDVIVHKDVAR
jgi:ferrous-iron efflux pump FieF